MGLGAVNIDVGKIAAPLGSIFNNIIDKIAPDKMSDAEKEKYRLEYNAQMNEHLKDISVSFYDLVKTQMSAKINIIVDTARGLVRPVITYSAWGFYCWTKWVLVKALHKWYLAAIAVPEADTLALTKEFVFSAFTWYDFIILSTIIGFWFGDRMLTRYVARATDSKIGTAPAGIPVKKKGIWNKIAGKFFG